MLYNNLLSERKNKWHNNKISVSFYQQCNEITKLKRVYPKLKIIYAQVLQNVAMRVDGAYQLFFKRVKAGDIPGYPRFKGYGQYNSFTYPSCECVKIREDSIYLPKIGFLSFVKHREILGNLKTLTIKRASSGKWYCYIVTDHIAKREYQKNNNIIGVDVGIINFATLSSGEKIANPRFFDKKSKELKKKHRKHQKEKSRTFKTLKAITKIHNKIANSRLDFAHKTANSLLKKYDTICIENIESNKMIRTHWCTQQILDVAWPKFFKILTYKAEWAGRKLIKINPAYTSQTCNKCGSRTLHELKDRIFNCSCGHSEDRDCNAAKNILALGLQSLAKA